MVRVIVIFLHFLFHYLKCQFFGVKFQSLVVRMMPCPYKCCSVSKVIKVNGQIIWASVAMTCYSFLIEQLNINKMLTMAKKRNYIITNPSPWRSINASFNTMCAKLIAIKINEPANPLHVIGRPWHWILNSYA